MRNSARKIVENIKTHFMLYIYIYIYLFIYLFIYFEIHSRYQIIRKNVFRQTADEDEKRRRKKCVVCAGQTERRQPTHVQSIIAS